MEVTTSERYASGGDAPELPAQNLVKAFYAVVDRLGDDVAIRDEARDQELNWNELRDVVHRIAGGLAKLGVKKDDTVAIMLGNRWEFIPSDLAAVSLGAIPFSVYQTYAPEQIEYLLSDAESKVVITERAFLENVKEALRDLPGVEHLIVVDGEGGDHTLDEVMEMDPDFDPAESVEAVGPDDLLTLIYTSGTTGPPKGVQLTHRNLLFAVATADEMIQLPERGGKVISWLPAAHVAERNAHYYLPMTRGLSVHICADPRRIAEFLPKVKPTWFFAVPRIFEKLKAGLEAMLAGLPEEQRETAQKGLDASLAKVRAEQAGEEVPPEVAEAAAQADEQMFSALRHQLGLDEALAVNAGAAPTPLEVLEFFHAIGIPVGELWGMSETCGLGTINPPDRIKLGTVGPPTPGIEIRLDDDGEVLVKADCVMPGYRKLPEKNDRGVHGRRLAPDRRHRGARRGRLPEDRRSQEGADHQRRGQEHVTGEHRVAPEDGQPPDRPGMRDRQRPALQHGSDSARPGLRASLGFPERPGGQVGRGAGDRREGAGGGPGRHRRGEYEDGEG